MEAIITFINKEIEEFDKLLVTYENIREELKKEGVKNDRVNQVILLYTNQIKKYNKAKELLKTLK